MTRDIKMLLAIVAGAALAGWVVVRLGAPPADAPEPRVAARAEPVAEQRLEEAPEPDRVAPPRPAPSAGADETDSEAIVRDLNILVRAVRKDKHLEGVAFPESTRILEFPRMVHYVRAVEFWQPAFPSTEGDR